MRAVPVLLLTLALLQLCLAAHSLYELGGLSQQQLEEEPLVEVEEASDNKTENNSIRPNYYIIKSMHKEKKHAYMRMQALFKEALSFLLRNRIIPHEDSLVKSRIKPQYLAKKRSWSFSTIFVIFGNEQELERCYKQFTRLRIQRLSTKPSINFLNEKVVALEVFNSAKEKLAKQLQRFPQLQIKEVVEIEIKGAQVENSDILEMQLEDQFNESEEVISEQQIITAGLELEKTPLSMKILFRVGRVEEEDESYGEEVEEEEEEEETEEDEEMSNESDESL